jgi:large repetitive protein
VKVDADAVGTTLRNVVVAPASVNCPEPTVGADVADDCTTEHPVPAWTLEKSSDPVTGTEVDPGEKVTYTLTVVNTSETGLVDATVVDDLSDVLDDATLDAVPAGATVDGDELTWAVPGLAPGESATLSYTVTVDRDAAGVTLDNVAVPVQPTGSCVAADRCETTHPVPQIEGRDITRPRPAVTAPDQVLPSTGAPQGTGWLVAGGGLAVVLGAWLAFRTRRRLQIR